MAHWAAPPRINGTIPSAGAPGIDRKISGRRSLLLHTPVVGRSPCPIWDTGPAPGTINRPPLNSPSRKTDENSHRDIGGPRFFMLRLKYREARVPFGTRDGLRAHDHRAGFFRLKIGFDKSLQARGKSLHMDSGEARAVDSTCRRLTVSRSPLHLQGGGVSVQR